MPYCRKPSHFSVKSLMQLSLTHFHENSFKMHDCTRVYVYVLIHHYSTFSTMHHEKKKRTENKDVRTKWWRKRGERDERNERRTKKHGIQLRNRFREKENVKESTIRLKWFFSLLFFCGFCCLGHCWLYYINLYVSTSVYKYNDVTRLHCVVVQKSLVVRFTFCALPKA